MKMEEDKTLLGRVDVELTTFKREILVLMEHQLTPGWLNGNKVDPGPEFGPGQLQLRVGFTLKHQLTPIKGQQATHKHKPAVHVERCV